MTKVIKFSPKGDFSKALGDAVEHYFVANDIAKTGDWRLYSKTIILFIALMVVYGTILMNPTAHWLEICVRYGLLGIIVASIGFNVMHDAAHGSYSSNKRLNNIITWLGGDLMGGSTFMWKVKHNVLHHTYTNIDGFDDDIAKYPLFRLSPHQEKRWWHRFQAIYAIVFYSIITINWFLIDDYVKYFTKRLHPKVLKMKSRDHIEFWAGKVANALLFIVIPIMVIGWQNALIGFVALNVTLGITLALVFQMAHVVEEVDFPTDVEGKIKDDNMIHQLKTTTNFAMDNSIINWYVGGLNYQVEHHLFSHISHIHYPAISRIVQDFCEKYNITYNAFPTFVGAITSHFVYLHRVGRK